MSGETGGRALHAALVSVQYDQIERFSPESLDWLYESDPESVKLLNWLTKTLNPESYLSGDQVKSFVQIPVSERLSGGKVLEDALQCLEDENSSLTNEDLEKSIGELESELGYYNESCDTLAHLKEEISDSERMCTVMLNRLQEQVEKGKREGRKVQESVLEANTTYNLSLEKLQKALTEYVHQYDNSKSHASEKIHTYQIDVQQLSSREHELEQRLGSLIGTVFGDKFSQLGLGNSTDDDTKDSDQNRPDVMDLESKDLLELVRGRDRTEFEHLKSEIYRIRACLLKTEVERIECESRDSSLLACINTLKQSLRLNKNTVLVQIPGENNDKESILNCLQTKKLSSGTKEMNESIKSLVSKVVNQYCQRVLLTDYSIKYRRSAYIFEKLKSIRNELLLSRARESLVDLLLVHEAGHVTSVVQHIDQTDKMLQQRLRKRKGFKTGVDSLKEDPPHGASDDQSNVGTVVKPDDFIFTSLHKILRITEHVDPVATYSSVEQAVATLINQKHKLTMEIQENKASRIQSMQSIETGMRKLFCMLHIDQFSPSRGISLMPKEVNRAIGHVDKQIKELEMKLKGILTDWERAKSDLKTRPYHRTQRQLWIEFLLKPELVPANLRAVQNRAK